MLNRKILYFYEYASEIRGRCLGHARLVVSGHMLKVTLAFSLPEWEKKPCKLYVIAENAEGNTAAAELGEIMPCDIMTVYHIDVDENKLKGMRIGELIHLCLFVKESDNRYIKAVTGIFDITNKSLGMLLNESFRGTEMFRGSEYGNDIPAAERNTMGEPYAAAEKSRATEQIPVSGQNAAAERNPVAGQISVSGQNVAAEQTLMPEKNRTEEPNTPADRNTSVQERIGNQERQEAGAAFGRPVASETGSALCECGGKWENDKITDRGGSKRETSGALCECGRNGGKWENDGLVDRSGGAWRSERTPDTRCMKDHVARLMATRPEYQPFSSGRISYSVRIGIGDILHLSEFEPGLKDNSFLLHGFYRYKHILLASGMIRGQMNYYVLVPGVKTEREQRIADMYGFHEFMSLDGQTVRQGNFGYYSWLLAW